MVEIYFRRVLVVEDLEFIRGDTHSVNEVSLRNLPEFKEINTIRVLPGLTTIWLSNGVTFLCTGTGRTIVKRSVRVKRRCSTVTVASNHHRVYDHMAVKVLLVQCEAVCQR
jgi:hypothetical protein